MRRTWLWLGCTFAASIVYFTTAQSAATDRRPWVQLRFSVGAGLDPALAREIEVDLRVGLQRNGIDVGSTHPAGPYSPSMTVLISITKSKLCHLVVYTDPASAKQRVERNLDLRGLPRDGQSLAIAVAAEELIRTRWHTLVVQSDPAHTPEETLRHTETNRSSDPPNHKGSRSGLTHETGLFFSGQYFAGNATLLGGGIYYSLWFSGLAGLELRLAGGGMLPTEATHGTIDGRALSTELNLLLALLRKDGLPLTLDTAVGAQLFFTDWTGTPHVDGIGDDVTLPAMAAHVHLAPSWVVTRHFAVRAQLGCGYVFWEAEVLDGDQVATALAGILLRAHLSLALFF